MNKLTSKVLDTLELSPRSYPMRSSIELSAILITALRERQLPLGMTHPQLKSNPPIEKQDSP